MARFRAAWVMLAAALGCGDGPSPASPNYARTLDAGATGPFDITIASSPPIELPGVALWLDADYGVAHEGDQVRAWTDRSGHGHVVERQAGDDPGPITARLAGHGALRFGGRARLALSSAIDDQARAALTIGTDDFLIALVLRTDGASESTLFALAPRDGVPPSATALLSLMPSLQFTLGTATVTTAATLDGPHLVVVLGQGPRLVVRVDGQEVGMRPFGRLAGEKMDGASVALPFLAPVVGAWDPDLPGLSGLVGDVVVLTGPGVEGSVAPLEDYLTKKYGL